MQDVNKKNSFSPIFFILLLPVGTFRSVLKDTITSYKEVTKLYRRKSRFFFFFCLVMDGVSGSGRLENLLQGFELEGWMVKVVAQGRARRSTYLAA
jgi:hypothetical protein